jgi:hypothetical protein
VELDAEGDIELLDPITVEEDVGLPPRDVVLR